MDGAYISALAALGGSGVGALSSLATTWLSQTGRYRMDHRDKVYDRREMLYVTFINEASEAFADAITHDMEDPMRLVKIYSVMSRMRLFASTEILDCAQAVLDRIVETYRAPARRIGDLTQASFKEMDLLADFSTACRHDLSRQL